MLIPVRPVDVPELNSRPSAGRPDLLDRSTQSESGQPVILPEIQIEENNWSASGKIWATIAIARVIAILVYTYLHTSLLTMKIGHP